MLFHIASAADWARRAETYTPPSFDSDGFIHCATAAQVDGVASRLFHGRADLLLIAIEPGRVRAHIRYENLEGGDEQFPHIYGPLNLDAVVGVRALRVDGKGERRPLR